MRIIHKFTICFPFLLSVASAAPLVGVYFGGPSANSVPNWTLVTTAGTVNNLSDTNGAPTAISLNVTGSPSPLGYTSGIEALASTVPSDAPLSNLNSNFYNAGGSMTAQFSGLMPKAYYSLYVIGIRFVGALNQSVTITGNGAPVMFTQSGAQDSLFINGSIGSSSQTLESDAVLVQASGTGTITLQVVADAGSPSRYNVAGIALSAGSVLAPTPAPSSLILILMGLAAVGSFFLIRRKRSSQF